MALPAPTLEEQDIDRLSDQGRQLYEDHLRSALEPEHNGETVAIHLDSGDYAVGRNSPTAMRALRQRRSEGMIMTMIIGPPRPDPTLDRILARRMLAALRQ